jgi:hypothetical protein
MPANNLTVVFRRCGYPRRGPPRLGADVPLRKATPLHGARWRRMAGILERTRPDEAALLHSLAGSAQALPSPADAEAFGATFDCRAGRPAGRGAAWHVRVL